MILTVWDALRARLVSEHWELIADRDLVRDRRPPILLLTYDPPERRSERYDGLHAQRRIIFGAEIIAESAESALWRQEHLESLLADWRPTVEGVRLGRVVPYVRARAMPPDRSLPDRVLHSVVSMWETTADPTT